MRDTRKVEPIAYPPSAILTREDLAAWLKVHPDTVKVWPIPRLNLPGQTVRYSAGMVLAYLEGRLDEYMRRSA